MFNINILLSVDKSLKGQPYYFTIKQHKCYLNHFIYTIINIFPITFYQFELFIFYFINNNLFKLIA